MKEINETKSNINEKSDEIEIHKLRINRLTENLQNEEQTSQEQEILIQKKQNEIISQNACINQLHQNIKNLQKKIDEKKPIKSASSARPICISSYEFNSEEQSAITLSGWLDSIG